MEGNSVKNIEKIELALQRLEKWRRTSLSSDFDAIISALLSIEDGLGNTLRGAPAGADFTTAWTSTEVLTISDMPSSHPLLYAYEIEKIVKIATLDGKWTTYLPGDGTGGTFIITDDGANGITISGMTSLTGDEFVVYTSVSKTSSVSGGVSSGGMSTWELDSINSIGQGQVTTGGTGLDTITVDIFYTTMKAEKILEIQEFDSTGAKVGTHNHDNALITVSGDTITVAGKAWGASSTFVVIYAGIERNTNLDSNAQANEQINTVPWHNQWQHLVDEASLAIGTYFTSIDMYTFNTLDVAIVGDAGPASIEAKLYRTYDKDAVVPATGGTAGATWHEITTDTFGGTVPTTPAVGTDIDESEANIKGSPVKYLLEYIILTGAATSFDVWYRKYFV